MLCTAAVEARFIAAVQTDPGAYPASYTVGTGVKRPGRGVDRPPLSSARAQMTIQYGAYAFYIR